MTDDHYTKFRNDNGVREMRIGVKEFKCIGASPPHDHPHVYLQIGDDETILCPLLRHHVPLRFAAAAG